MKIVNKTRFIISISVILIIIVSILNLSFAKEEIHTEDYVISQGETLWSIACENCPKGNDVRKYIYDLRELNNIGCDLQIGQVIKIIK